MEKSYERTARPGAKDDKSGKKSKAYKEYFRKKLEEYGVDDPSELPAKKKHDFFLEVDKGWDSKKEKGQIKEQRDAASIDAMTDLELVVAELEDRGEFELAAGMSTEASLRVAGVRELVDEIQEYSPARAVRRIAAFFKRYFPLFKIPAASIAAMYGVTKLARNAGLEKKKLAIIGIGAIAITGMSAVANIDFTCPGSNSFCRMSNDKRMKEVLRRSPKKGMKTVLRWFAGYPEEKLVADLEEFLALTASKTASLKTAATPKVIQLGPSETKELLGKQHKAAVKGWKEDIAVLKDKIKNTKKRIKKAKKVHKKASTVSGKIKANLALKFHRKRLKSQYAELKDMRKSMRDDTRKDLGISK